MFSSRTELKKKGKLHKIIPSSSKIQVGVWYWSTGLAGGICQVNDSNGVTSMCLPTDMAKPAHEIIFLACRDFELVSYLLRTHNISNSFPFSDRHWRDRPFDSDGSKWLPGYQTTAGFYGFWLGYLLRVKFPVVLCKIDLWIVAPFQTPRSYKWSNDLVLSHQV